MIYSPIMSETAAGAANVCGLTPTYVVFASAAGCLTEDAGFTYDATNDRLSVRNITIAQAAQDEGTPTAALLMTFGAHTDLDNSEAVDVNLSGLTRTVNFDGGGAAISIQRAIWIGGPTYSADAAQTITNAATFYVEGPPVAGVNMTLSTSWAIWVDEGPVRFDVSSIGATSVDADLGLLIHNETDAAAGAQQYSPMFVMEGQGWKTDATAATREVQFALQVIPIQGAAAPTGELQFFGNIADNGFVKNMALLFDGTTGASGQLQIYRSFTAVGPTDATTGFRIENAAPADGVTNSQSPLMVFEGQAYDGASSFEVQFGLYVQPRSTGGGGGGNQNSTGLAAIDTQQQLRIAYNTADGGWTNSLIFAADGSISPTTVAGNTSNQLPIVYGYGRMQSQRLIATSGAVSDDATYQYLLVQTGALVGLTSYELVEFDLGAATTNFAAGGGTTATAFGVSIKGPTIAAATDARTITDAATFYIDDSPDASTNITISSSWAIWVDDGQVRFDLEGVGSGAGTDDIVGLLVANNTAAANGATQNSPALVWEGQGWDADGAVSTEMQMFAQLRITQGNIVNGSLVFRARRGDTTGDGILVVEHAGSQPYTEGNERTVIVTNATTDGQLRAAAPGLGATTSDAAIGIMMVNSTAAAAGAQQYSSMLLLEGQGWKTDATAATREVQFALQVIPVQGAAAPTGQLTFFSNIADGGYTARMRIDTNTAATETALWIYDGDNATLERVTVGVADSGGSGFKLLRIPN